MGLKDLKQKIIDEIPISEVVARFIPVTRRGNSTLAVCPFHDDTNPSMNISDNRRYYKCFSCGAGGNAIDFVMNFKNLTFLEALREISDAFGLCFEDFSEESKKSPRELMARKILLMAAKLYQKYAHTGQFPPFSDFIKKRELDLETANTYQLGYAPKNSVISVYLESLKDPQERDLAIKVAIEIGLIRNNERGDQAYFDTFRERIIFPIWDHFGQVIGFTSRAVFDYQKAKYMNSKESFIFNKRNILYGLHFAKSEIRKCDALILVEGNMDHISLGRKGFCNSVAVMGVALGPHSLKTIKALTQNIYLCLDNDQAGMKAAGRINTQFLQEGIVARSIDLGAHKDPDDFLTAEGSVEFQKKIDEAPPYIDLQLENLLRDHPAKLLDQKLNLLKMSFEVVSILKMDLRATERLVQFAKKLGLQSSSEQITSQYNEFLNNEVRPSIPTPDIDSDEQQEVAIDLPSPSEQQLAANPDVSVSTRTLSAPERRLVQELVQHPECLTGNKLGELLDFVGPSEVKDYVLKLKNLIYEIDEDEYISVVAAITKREVTNPDLSKAVQKGLALYHPIRLEEQKRDQLLLDIEKTLIKERLREKKKELKLKKDTIESLEELNILLHELQKIEKELLNLNHHNPQKGVT